MRIKPEFRLDISKNPPVIVRDAAINAAEGLPLENEQSLFLWNYMLENECGKEQLLHALLKEYDISTVLALNYIDKFLKPLIEKEIIEP